MSPCLVFAFLAGLIGHLLAFKSRLFGAILTGLLFAVAFVVWTYYPLDPRIHAAVPVTRACEFHPDDPDRAGHPNHPYHSGYPQPKP